MILPHQDATITMLLVLCMLCWGSWPVFHKMAKKYRFELFYFDFGIGLGVLALLCGLTFGRLGFDGFNFSDDLLNARKQDWLFVLLAAMIFNFGNMLTLAAASIAGMSVAFPLALGVAMIVGAWMNFLGQSEINIALLVGGTLIVAMALALGSGAYSHLKIVQHEALARAGKTKSTRRPSSIKAILLSLVGGLVLGTYAPLLLRAQDPDTGLGPYSLLFLFSIGVVVSTFIFNLFFMNLPVEGDPLEIADYIKTPIKNHVLGLFSGAVWGIGAIAVFVANTPKGDAHPSGAIALMLQQAAPILAALWGLLVWKEFKGGDARAKAFAGLMLVLFTVGLALFSVAAAK